MKNGIECVALSAACLLFTGCTTQTGGAQNRHTVVEYNGNYSCLVPDENRTTTQLQEALIAALENANGKNDSISREAIKEILWMYRDIKKMELIEHALYRACEQVGNGRWSKEKSITVTRSAFQNILEDINNKTDGLLEE